MADSVLASAVILGARERADDVLDEAVADDSEILRYLVQAWKRLYGFYVAAEPDRFRTESTINTVANTATVALPATWFATIGLDYAQSASGNVFIPLRRLQEHERHYFNGTASAAIAQAYRVIGETLTFYPTPSAVASYRHIWIPTAPAIASVATALDVRNGHDEYLEMMVARRMLKKEQAYRADWEDEIAKIEETLTNEANLRYMNAPDTQARFRKSWQPYDAADYYPRRGGW